MRLMRLQDTHPQMGTGRVATPDGRFITGADILAVFRRLRQDQAVQARRFTDRMTAGWAGTLRDFALYEALRAIVGHLLDCMRSMAARFRRERRRIEAAQRAQETAEVEEFLIAEIVATADDEELEGLAVRGAMVEGWTGWDGERNRIWGTV